MAVRAVRGATHLSADDADEMREAVVELLGEMLDRNGLSTEDLISVLFTATPDLVAVFPASAARSLDIADVPADLRPGDRCHRGDAQGRPGDGARGDRPDPPGRHPRLPARHAGAACGPRLVSRLPEPVLLVGTGLIGTSVALALRRAGVQVLLSDRDPEALALASARGAGHPVHSGITPRPAAPGSTSTEPSASAEPGVPGPTKSTSDEQSGPDGVPLVERDPVPGLVVVAVPPGSSQPRSQTRCAGSHGQPSPMSPRSRSPSCARWPPQASTSHRYVGGHPMAGREVSGPGAARADLLRDRPWVITPHEGADVNAVDAVRALVRTTGALPIVMTADRARPAVALVSHTPQVLSTLLAARLLDSSEVAVSIAGQGLRDMTRIAASDPGLWAEILTANAVPLAEVLAALRRDLDTLVHALGSSELGNEETLAEALRRGNAGHATECPASTARRQPPRRWCRSPCPTSPVELGRLFAAVAEAGCSVEDVRIEHVLGRPTGVVEISVAVAAVRAAVVGVARAGLGRARLRRWRPAWQRPTHPRDRRRCSR